MHLKCSAASPVIARTTAQYLTALGSSDTRHLVLLSFAPSHSLSASLPSRWYTHPALPARFLPVTRNGLPCAGTGVSEATPI
eukprot:scaffold96419_cov32-Tisochrysis_lutea.AAC.2